MRTLFYGAVVATVTFAVAMPVAIVLLLDPAPSAAGCAGGQPAGPGPTTASGVPTQYLAYYEGAAQRFSLGSDGWAYLAAINQAESDFATDNGPGTGVLYASNPAGAAGPMQIGIGGAASDNWDAVKDLIPPDLPGGAQPPSVYDPADAIYAAAALLQSSGAPGDWPAALKAWNDDPAEWAQIYEHVALYTQGPSSQQPPAGAGSDAPQPRSASVAGGGLGCVPGGPSTPGAVATIDPQTGLAAIPQGAPEQVQQMIAAGNKIISQAYSYGGGHCAQATAGPSGLSACPGSEENGAPGYDCSGAVEDLLSNGGGVIAAMAAGFPASGSLQTAGVAGPGQWVTVYANPDHTFIEVAGIVLNTAWYAPVKPTAPATGPRWQPASTIEPQIHGDSLGWFDEVHPQGL